MSKTCSKCHTVKPIDNFYSKRATCKRCYRLQSKPKTKNYYKPKITGPKKYNIDPEVIYDELEHYTQMELSKKYNVPQSTLSYWKLHKSTLV